MDKSGQITYVNYIYANHLERHVPGRKQHGQAVVAAERRKKTMLGYQPIPYSDWVHLNILSSFVGHIDAQIKPTDNTPMWRFIGFYGNPSTENRMLSWTLLRRLKDFALPLLKILPEKVEALELLKKKRGLPSYSSSYELALIKEIDRLQDLKDMYRKTRSNISWLKNDDHNSSYFLHKASQRKKKNIFQALINEQGQRIDDDHELENISKKLGGLGFRNLESFNMALLANRGLRLAERFGYINYTLESDYRQSVTSFDRLKNILKITYFLKLLILVMKNEK
ncbi:hypothetical protein M9H77_23101 [Catharanthus roseus]|uniref:Uncharacterized protein n=1 Tax=Catharanthus roseus TaxID=4058 RepID=A0ACC0AS31_CATRO|nr:hypothetical protein M9H77_23101 [Catharanthus roseus]